MEEARGYLIDSPDTLLHLSERAETVVISLFSSTIELILSEVGDTVQITLLLIVILILWNMVQNFIMILTTVLWKETEENERSILEKRADQKNVLFRIYYGKNSWHSVFRKFFDFISVILYYLTIQFLMKIVFISWNDKEFGILDSIIAVIIIVIAYLTVRQVLHEVSVIEAEIKLLLDDSQNNNMNVDLNIQDEVIDY